ncbi:MAG: hypothetical protein NZ553_14880 [Caldilinea sp.]|nr:hypothetical protein [Caldilinea sp.]MDW8441756.1 hypothetical protein [Caldilineaceae bacterium]
MDAFLSFHAAGFWLVMALILGVAALGAKPYLPTTVQPFLMPAFWVLTPYLALIAGGVSPRLVGLYFIDWAVSLRIGIGLALALFAFALLARAASMWTVDGPEKRGARPGVEQWLDSLATIGLCGAEEFFWSFLRGALDELFVTFPIALDAPGYWAVWSAALLAAPMAVFHQPKAVHRLVKLVILAMTSILFFYTRNFWLCWALHALSWMLMLQSVNGSAPRTKSTARSRPE